jgi:hypothetical protein
MFRKTHQQDTHFEIEIMKVPATCSHIAFDPGNLKDLPLRQQRITTSQSTCIML